MNTLMKLRIGPPGNTEVVKSIDERVIKYNENGIIEVEYFNEQETGDQLTNLAQSESEDNKLFGTHVREAARILRGC